MLRSCITIYIVIRGEFILFYRGVIYFVFFVIWNIVYFSYTHNLVLRIVQFQHIENLPFGDCICDLSRCAVHTMDILFFYLRMCTESFVLFVCRVCKSGCHNVCF